MVATFETDSFAYHTSERSIGVSISDTSNVRSDFFSTQQCWFKLWRLCVTFRPRCEVLPVTLWVAFALYIPLGFINAARWIVDRWACRWSPSWVYSLYIQALSWFRKMGDICSTHLHTGIPVSRHQHLWVLGCLMQRVGKKYMFFPKITVVNHGSRSPSSTSAAINLLESWGFEYQTLLTFTAKSGCVWNSCESLEHGACRIGSRFCCWVKKKLSCCFNFIRFMELNSLDFSDWGIRQNCGIWPSLFTQSHMKWFNKSFHLIMAKQGAWKDSTFWGICD